MKISVADRYIRRGEKVRVSLYIEGFQKVQNVNGDEYSQTSAAVKLHVEGKRLIVDRKVDHDNPELILCSPRCAEIYDGLGQEGGAAADGISPKYGWRETFESKVSMEMDVHNGKRFTVLADITDPAVRDDPDYGYVRVYRVRLEDGKVITAFDVEVEKLEDPS